MPSHVPFDEYETAFLIDACVRVQQLGISRQEEIERGSKTLRERALNRGMHIDDGYRSKKGIASQMHIVERLMEGKPPETVYASDLFVRLVKMYRFNRAQFEAILEAEKAIQTSGIRPCKQGDGREEKSNNQETADLENSESKSNCEGEAGVAVCSSYSETSGLNKSDLSFYTGEREGNDSDRRRRGKSGLSIADWLSKQGLSSETVDGYMTSLAIVDDFIRDHGLSETSLFDMESRETVEAVWNKLRGDKIVCEFDRKNRYCLSVALRHFIYFLDNA